MIGKEFSLEFFFFFKRGYFHSILPDITNFLRHMRDSGEGMVEN